MSYAQYLRNLLSPLGVYDLQAPFNGGELDALGAALDGVDGELEELQREMSLATAQSWGLERIVALLGCRPVADTPKALGQALAALLRISGDSFTLASINDTISGCGVYAAVAEGEEPGTVTVSFPNVPGVPDGFARIKEIIEGILPAHVEIQYEFWFITWAHLEQRFASWEELEAEKLTWEGVQKLVLEYA